MKIFKLYFNPKNRIFKNCQHTPEDGKEKKLGIFCMVGEVSEYEKSNLLFLNKLFKQAKEKYYKNSALRPQKAFEKALEKANEVVSDGGYSGKIDVAFFSIKNIDFYFSKIGKIKIIKLNKKEIKDLSESFYAYEPKLFQSVISGKIDKKEKLVISTPEISQIFTKKEIWEKETIKEISSLVNSKFSKMSGATFVIDHQPVKKKKRINIISEKTKSFSFKELLITFLSFFGDIEKPSFQIKEKVKSSVSRKKSKKKLFLILLVFASIFFLGFLTLKIKEKIKTTIQERKLITIEEDYSKGKENDNTASMEKAFFELEDFIKEKELDDERFQESYSLMKEELFNLSLGEEVKEMNLLGSAVKINPDKIILNNEDVYLFSFRNSLIEVLNSEKEYLLSENKNPLMGSASNDKIFLFSPPDNFYTIKNKKISETKINAPYENFSFVSMSSFSDNPYFLDSQGNIISYNEKNPFVWIKNNEKKVENGISFSIDGSIFIMNDKGDIYRYYLRERKETITFSVFPPLLNPENIYTNQNSLIFISDSSEKRLIVLNKQGEVLKQLSNEKFSNLKDIAISEDGKKIYLLINKQVYSLENNF
jgi:hypothetical protein